MNKRVFLAVNLPGETKKRIAAGLLSLVPGKGAKPVGEENLHITMAFLGYLNTEAVKQLAESLRQAGGAGEFEVELGGIGHFKNRVIWLGVRKGSDELESLRGKIDSALGISDEKFHPHVTLARNKSLGRGEVGRLLAALEGKGFCESIAAKSLDVMESVLGSGKPTYSVLEKIEFGKA